MAQLGLTLGARHTARQARVQRPRPHPGVSFLKRKGLTDEVKHDADLAAVGLLSIMWAIIKVHAPSEVIKTVTDAMAASGLPREMTTTNLSGAL